MTQHSEVKTIVHRYIKRIILIIETAVIINNSLDPGPQALAGLRHDVPVEGPQHLLHLPDKILVFVASLCNEPHFRFAPHKIAKRAAIRRAGRPDLLLLYTSATYRKASISQPCVLLLS